MGTMVVLERSGSGATPFRTLKYGLVVGDVAVLRSVATALPKCSKQGGWWGLMVVGQSEAIAERPGPNFGVVGRG